jgi:outer membrane protein, heavy metal efflux system
MTAKPIDREVRALALAAALALLGGCAGYRPEPIAPAKTAAAFGARSLADPGLLAFLRENGRTPPERWGLEDLTLAAFYYQPELAAAREQTAQARAAVQTAGERPNPTLNFTPGYDSGIAGAPSPWILPAGIDVPVELWGKRAARLAAARDLAEASRWDLAAGAWQARSRVRGALLELYAAKGSEALLAEQADAEGRSAALLEGQERAGEASDYEVTQARLAWDSGRLALGAGRQRESDAVAAAIGVPAGAVEAARLSFAGLDQFPRNPAPAEARRDALLGRADVRAALARYAASQEELKLAVRGQYPDLTLGPGYSWNSGSAGDDEWDLGLGLQLPILNRNQGPIAEARAARKAAAANFLAVQAAAIGEVEGAVVAYRQARGEAEAAAAMAADLARRRRAIRAQQAAGEVDPLAAAGAEEEVAAGELSRLDAEVRAQQALGRLEDAVQSPAVLSPAELGRAAMASEDFSP